MFVFFMFSLPVSGRCPGRAGNVQGPWYFAAFRDSGGDGLAAARGILELGHGYVERTYVRTIAPH